jgi:hypothetical protein
MAMVGMQMHAYDSKLDEKLPEVASGEKHRTESDVGAGQ